MLVLKMIKNIKSWNIPKYVVVKASLEPMPQNLAKTKSGAIIRQLYQSLLFHTDFFGGFDRHYGCLNLYHSLSVWHSGLLEKLEAQLVKFL